MTNEFGVRKKPPVVEQVVEMTMRLGRQHLADYGAARSRHDFTQRRLLTCLVLRAYLKCTYRGVLEVLAVSDSLRQRLGLTGRLPHFTTLQKFNARSQVLALVEALVARIGKAAAQQAPAPTAVAVDSTGLATSTASAYFRSRCDGPCRQWVKLSVVVLCGSLLPVGMALDLGPSNDRVQMPKLLSQAQAVSRPKQLYADAGYDAEWIHERCRRQWGVESLIKPARQRLDGTRNGVWRSLMSTEHLRERGYGWRWAVESYFSGLKRTMGGALSARRPEQQLAEAAFRVLAYALRR